MAEPPTPDTPDKAVKAFIDLIALGFACAGGDAMLRGSVGLGIFAFALAALFTATSYKWADIKDYLGPRFATSLGNVATDARWWVGVSLAVIVSISASPFVEQQQWPFYAWFQTTRTTIAFCVVVLSIGIVVSTALLRLFPQVRAADQSYDKSDVTVEPVATVPLAPPDAAELGVIGQRQSTVPQLEPSLTTVDNSGDWGKLYEEYESSTGRRELRLRFLPDTQDEITDALVLVCYGYKVLRNVDSVNVAFVDSQIDYLLLHAPNSRARRSTIWSISAMLTSAARPDYGKGAVGAYVERVGLSEGGKYKLTEYGEEHAAPLARDLISRA